MSLLSGRGVRDCTQQPGFSRDSRDLRQDFRHFRSCLLQQVPVYSICILHMMFQGVRP